MKNKFIRIPCLYMKAVLAFTIILFTNVIAAIYETFANTKLFEDIE